MTEGRRKLKEGERTSRSYVEMTSTFPWHHSVIAFCQWTTFRGSYVALRRSVCSIKPESLCLMGSRGVKGRAGKRRWADNLGAHARPVPPVTRAPGRPGGRLSRAGGVRVHRGDSGAISPPGASPGLPPPPTAGPPRHP